MCGCGLTSTPSPGAISTGPKWSKKMNGPTVWWEVAGKTRLTANPPRSRKCGRRIVIVEDRFATQRVYCTGKGPTTREYHRWPPRRGREDNWTSVGSFLLEGRRHDDDLRLYRRRHSRQARQARPLQGQGAARRQHRERMWLHTAVQGTRSALREVPQSRSRSARLSVQPVRQAGAGNGSGDRKVLRSELWRDVSVVRQGRRQRRRRRADLSLPEVGEARIARDRGDQMEFHQVPRRPRRQGHRASGAERHAGIDYSRYREGAVITRIIAAFVLCPALAT